MNTHALEHPATLHTSRLRLEPLAERHFDGVYASVNDPEAARLTGTHATFTPEQVRAFLRGLPARADRADWAIVREADGVFLGEVVLNSLDPDNRSMNFRIALGGAQHWGQGYGTEATRAVRDYGLDRVGLHRIHLGVLAFNPRALRAYQKCGFVQEGIERDALLWEGVWVDQIRMAILATDPRAAS